MQEACVFNLQVSFMTKEGKILIFFHHFLYLKRFHQLYSNLKNCLKINSKEFFV